VDEGVTVEDLLNHLMGFEDIVNLVFMGHTRGFKLKPFYDSMSDVIVEDEHISKLDFIEFHWVAEYTEYEEEVDDDLDPTFGVHVSFSGVDDSVDKNTMDKPRYYGLSLSPLQLWKHLPIKVNDSFNIYSFKKNKETEKYEYVSLLEGKRDFSFYEFIGGFLHEISFHGYPDTQKVIADKLSSITYSVDESSVKKVSWDETELEMLEEEFIDLTKKKKELLDDEKYEEIPDVDKDMEVIQEMIKEIKDRLGK
jgi:hypothetical protein